MDEDIYNLILSYLSNMSQQVNARLATNPRLLKAYYFAIATAAGAVAGGKFLADIVDSKYEYPGGFNKVDMIDPTYDPKKEVVTFEDTQVQFSDSNISDIIIYSRNILDELFLDKINYYTALNDIISLPIVNDIHAYLKKYITDEDAFETYFDNLKKEGKATEGRRADVAHIFKYRRIMALALLFEAINAREKISFFSILFAGDKPNLNPNFKPYINVNTVFIKTFLDAVWYVFGATDKTPYQVYKLTVGFLMS